MNKHCHACGQAKPVEQFYKNVTMKDGYQSRCKGCMKPAYKQCRDRQLDRYRALQEKRRIELTKRFHAWKTQQGCAHLGCDEKDPVCLDLHHLTPNTKERTPSSLLSYSWKRLMEEAKKCIVVCSNCHRKIHAKRKTHRGMLVHTTKVRPNGKEDKVYLGIA